MDLTPKQQTSEAIRQADSILIMTGQHPSVDQSAAVISLAMILRKFGKQVTAAVSDSLPSATSILDTTQVEKTLGGSKDFILRLDVSKAEVDKLRYEVQDGKLNIIITPYKGNFAPSDVTFDHGASQAQYDLAIVLGVPSRSRIDRIYEQNSSIFANMPVLNIDYHRSNENYGAVNLIDPNASSLCEILVALSESLQGGIIDADMATALLMGIVGSTDRFTAAHTTSKSLTVAAQMMAAGAKQPAVMKALYRDNRDGRNERNDRGNSGGGNSGSDRNASDRNGRDSQRGQRQSAQQQSQPQPAQSEPVQRPSNPDAIREQKPAPELPIIAPAHIEMIQDSGFEPDNQQPQTQPAAAPQPPAPAAPPAQPEAPNGQLPPEMSPLGGPISGAQAVRPSATAPLAQQQLQHNE